MRKYKELNQWQTSKIEAKCQCKKKKKKTAPAYDANFTAPEQQMIFYAMKCLLKYQNLICHSFLPSHFIFFCLSCFLLNVTACLVILWLFKEFLFRIDNITAGLSSAVIHQVLSCLRVCLQCQHNRISPCPTSSIQHRPRMGNLPPSCSPPLPPQPTENIQRGELARCLFWW